MDRRHFLAAAGALPLAIAPPRAQDAALASRRATRPPHEGFGPWIEVDRNHLSWNVEQVSRRIAGRPILAVVKANAYGHGLVGTVRHLETLAGVGGFAVFRVDEAVTLRDAGMTKPVLVLGPATDADLETLVQLDVTPSVYEDRGELLARLAAGLGRPVRIQLYVDTGLGRMGVPYHRAAALIESLAERPGIQFEGVLTTLTEDADFDREQLRRFADVCDTARRRGVDLGRRHAASSSAVFHLPEAHLDMVRPGISLYGGYPGSADSERPLLALRPAVTLKARVMYVKQLRPGDSLQYHRAYVATAPVWVATLPVGYSDGLPRGTADTCSVLISGHHFPLIAAVTSNHCLVEIGAEPLVRVGDEALFFGTTNGGSIDPHEVAARAGVSVYSLLIGMNPLLPRVYI